MSRRATTQDKFIYDSAHVHNNKYDYSLVSYTTTHSKVKIICPMHGVFEQAPVVHKRGQGCPHCAVRRKPNTLQDFVSDSNRVHNNKYDYSLVSYTNTHSKVKIICPMHGVFEQTPSQHKDAKHGCPKCAYNVTRTNTNLNRFGVKYPQLHPSIKYKSIKTMIKRYGVEHALQSDIIKENRRQSNILKYGVPNNNQQHMTDILSLVQDSDWLFDQYVTQNKNTLQLAQELNITSSTVLRYLHSHEIKIRQYTYSYKSIQWLDSIMEREGIFIQHAGNIGEYQIPDTRYKADGYCKETNTVYEFHGDYWHGNPDVYDFDVINESTNCTMGELYQRTIEREQIIKELGYNLVSIWENNIRIK